MHRKCKGSRLQRRRRHPSANFADFGNITDNHRRKKSFAAVHRSKREPHSKGDYSGSRAGMWYEFTLSFNDFVISFGS